MEEIFVSNIDIKKVRHISDLSISLSENERKHLIITGKNGSGKTSVLLELRKFLDGVIRGQAIHKKYWTESIINFREQLSKLEESPELHKHLDKVNLLESIKINEMNLKILGEADIKFNNESLLREKVNNGSFIITLFDAKRNSSINLPSGINKLQLSKKYGIEENIRNQFMQYIVNMKADRSFARDEGEEDVVEKIDRWFERFEKGLKRIFSSPSLKLKFDRKEYNFEIIEEGKEAYDFSTLSDGYASIISIVTELLLRMEAHGVKNYDMQGLVLIDEIETHLHVELQKSILPFLIDFFPKIQFIVTTHSPFVITSIPNAVICDLEDKVVINEDLSGYSYSALIESYFDSDKYSEHVKQKVIEYENLSSNDNLNENDKDKLEELKKYFDNIPDFFNDELQGKLKEISFKSLTSKMKQ